ncbi:hypothetical protein HDU83_009392 [Entophlyctis luteolus]|nr:hypothetical protein HDU83_009392 [Entophlyctis luteolus]
MYLTDWRFNSNIAIIFLLVVNAIFIVVKSVSDIENSTTRHAAVVSPAESDTDAVPRQCPKWEAFDVRQEGNADFSGNCRTVAETATFEVRLCESRTQCGHGYFMLRRKDARACAHAMALDVAWEPEFDAWLKREIGPDAFTVVFSGPQRAAPSDWRHVGDCVYKHPFRLTNPGNYTVSIIHTHDEFHAVQEKRRTWQRVVNAPLLKDFRLDVCANNDCEVFTVASVERMWKRLPLCDRVNPVQGVYLRSDETIEMVDREKYKYEAFKVPYFWVPLGCKYDQLFELGRNNNCHDRNRSIIFTGDSHVRITWDVLNHRFAGTKALLDRNIHEGSRKNYFYSDQTKNVLWEERLEIKPAAAQDRRTAIDFAGRDGFLTWLSSDYSRNPGYEPKGTPEREFETNEIDRRLKYFDSLVFNLGMWQMTAIRDGGHFTSARYRAFLTHIAETMMEINRRRSAMNREPMLFIWNGLPTYPVFQNFDEDDKIKKDWRSPYRLKIWSDIADDTLAKYAHMRRLDAFGMTMPFLYETPDSAHFFKTPAVEAETDELLHKLNLCDTFF